MQDLFTAFHSHPTLMWWTIGLSVATLLMTLLALPWMVLSMPADYFARSDQRGARVVGRGPVTHWVVEVAKNLLGGLLVLAGILLLVLPGQGLLTIIAGLFLMSFPGKYRLERWLVLRRPVWRAMQWLRQRMGKPRLIIGGRGRRGV